MAVELGGATMEVLNPASGDVIASVPRGELRPTLARLLRLFGGPGGQ